MKTSLFFSIIFGDAGGAEITHFIYKATGSYFGISVVFFLGKCFVRLRKGAVKEKFDYDFCLIKHKRKSIGELNVNMNLQWVIIQSNITTKNMIIVVAAERLKLLIRVHACSLSVASSLCYQCFSSLLLFLSHSLLIDLYYWSKP